MITRRGHRSGTLFPPSLRSPCERVDIGGCRREAGRQDGQHRERRKNALSQFLQEMDRQRARQCRLSTPSAASNEAACSENASASSDHRMSVASDNLGIISQRPYYVVRRMHFSKRLGIWMTH